MSRRSYAKFAFVASLSVVSACHSDVPPERQILDDTAAALAAPTTSAR